MSLSIALREIALATMMIAGNSESSPVVIEDLLCLTKSMYFEARGESSENKIGVAWVHVNRVSDSRFPNNICDVALDSSAFSWYSDGKSDKINDWAAYFNVLVIANAVLDGSLDDVTDGATHYYAQNITTPYWASSDSMTITSVIDTHTFMREGKRF